MESDSGWLLLKVKIYMNVTYVIYISMQIHPVNTSFTTQDKS